MAGDEVRVFASSNPPCAGCGGPHPFDTTLPSPVWNAIVRANGHADYLCLTCIVRVFIEADADGFVAELWGNDPPMDGLVVRVAIDDATPEVMAVRLLREESDAARVTRLVEAVAALRQWLREHGRRDGDWWTVPAYLVVDLDVALAAVRGEGPTTTEVKHGD